MTNLIESPTDDFAKFATVLDFEVFSLQFSKVIETVGTEDFYNQIANCLGQLMGCERQLVVRYGQYSRPEYIVNRSLPGDMIKIYYDKLYRLDPILRLVRKSGVKNVLSFVELRQSASDTYFYEESLKSHYIFDELAILLEALGGVWIAICVDRNDRVFSQSELHAAKAIFPMFDRLHRLHIGRSLQIDSGGLLSSSIAMQIFDRNGNSLFKNEKWEKTAPSFIALVSEKSKQSDKGKFTVTPSLIGHWRTLAAEHYFAPEGKIIVLEENSPGYIDLTGKSSIEKFGGVFSLTSREEEIVGLTLDGNPTARIADLMGVSLGTIRNHKYHIYAKMDITSERELFVNFFRMMME